MQPFGGCIGAAVLRGMVLTLRRRGKPRNVNRVAAVRAPLAIL